MKKIKSILISQPEPQGDKSPYADLAAKHNLKIDFRPFIKVEGVSAKELRQQKINLADFSAVIFTSKTAIDNYFRLAKETRFSVPDDMKYFCLTQSVANYLTKYIVYRKRKIFYGQGKIDTLKDSFKKHSKEYCLLPLSNISSDEIPNFLDKMNIKYKTAVFYKTLSADLSDLADVYYDILVFFSPAGIKSLFDNFPDFKQNDTKIAAFGKSTAEVIKERGLRLDIFPSKEAPSMITALDKYITNFNKRK